MSAAARTGTPPRVSLLLGASLASGVLFAIGLALSGMTEPAKVIGFLDVASGQWDPSLVFVMVGALTVTGVAWRFLKDRPAPVGGGTCEVPARKDIDARLVAGAAVFGLGWGLGGFCPGPGVVALATGALPAIAFVAAMLVGLRVVASIDQWRVRRVERAAEGVAVEG